jgi:arylsulfatase A-like enzyme
MAKPNILLIMTDQHRFDRLGCMGDPTLETPNIDSIAQSGVLFRNAYSPSPVCSPARAAIWSGMFPPACGVVGNWVPFKDEVELMTHRLQRQGYSTAMCGKLHFVPHEEQFGFDHRRMNDAPYSIYADDDRYSDYIAWLRERWQGKVDPVQHFDKDESAFQRDDWRRFILGSNFRQEHEHDIPWVVDESIQFLRQHDREKPFFLFTSFFGPHQPFAAPAPWDKVIDPSDVRLPAQFDAVMDGAPIFEAQCAHRAAQFRGTWDEQGYRELIAAYYGQVAMIDHYVGKLLAFLEQQALWDDTLVLFVSDHGDYNGAYGLFFKGQMYDACCKVPLLVKPPRSSCGGVVREEIVNTLDLYGTILEAASDREWRQPHIEARSLTPLLGQEGGTAWENWTYSIIGSDPARNLTMLRRDDLKLMRLARGPDTLHHELYDMADEVVETRNVFDDPRYEEEQRALVAELEAWSSRQAAMYPDEIVSYTKV